MTLATDTIGRPTGLLIGGTWHESGEQLSVIEKYTGLPFATVSRARPADVEAAVAAAHDAASRHVLSPSDRYAILRSAAELLSAWRDRVIRTYVAETGFTLRDAATELGRAQETLLLSAEEAKRLTGETIPVEASRGSEARIAFTLRVPVGVVCAISPFNAPLNNVAHKIAPALAAGNAVVLKPATLTPLCSTILCEALIQSGLPAGLLNMVVGPGPEVGDQLAQDGRIRYYTFTGSTRVGLSLKQRSGIAKTHLELGSTSTTVVCADADLDLASELIVRGGTRKAGQVCTSVQRVVVDTRVADALALRLKERMAKLVVGDPSDPSTDVGPMISPAEAQRAATWVAQAVDAGATLATGGEARGGILRPTLLVDTPTNARVMTEEVFAPVIATCRFDGIDEAVRLANATPYGLQSGVFTRDLDTAFEFARRVQVGGLMINDTSSYHADAMPFGGVKESGYGAEGPRYAIMDMTDPRTVVINLRQRTLEGSGERRASPAKVS